MECHPVRLEMCKHGCSSSVKIDLAFQLYIYLCEDMNAWDVSHSYSPELDLIYILAKSEKDANEDIFIPIDMNRDFTPNYLTDLQNELGVATANSPLKKIKLGFVGSDSTILIHEMTQGVAPLNPRRRKTADAVTVLAPALRQYAKEQQDKSME